MTTDRAGLTNEYLLGTKSVLQAGRELQKVLKPEANLDKRNSALNFMAEAGQKHDVGTQNYRRFMFGENEEDEISERGESTNVTENLFLNLVNDLEVANVYIAVGQNIGETQEAPKPYLLDDALNRLEQTTTATESVLTGSTMEGTGVVRYGLVEAAPVEALTSPDIQAAIRSFKSRGEETLNLIVSEAEGVVTTLSEDIQRLLDKVSPASVLAILEGLGGPLGQVPQLIGRFIQLGVEKIKSIIKTVTDVLGSDVLKKFSAEVAKLWKDITGGGLVVNLLRRIFGVEAAQTSIEEMLKRESLDKNKVDHGVNALAELALPYKNEMRMAKKAVKAISLGAGVLLVIPVAGVKVAALAATAYGLVLSLVLLNGIDYTRSGGLLKRVHGVDEITNSLKPSA